jgi:predicted secreted protein
MPMPDDDSVKILLERLCSLQEQQLAKLSEALDRAAAARERLENATDTWRKMMAKFEEAQKTQARKAVGYQVGAWLRAGFIVFMLGVIAIAIIVSHYL